MQTLWQIGQGTFLYDGLVAAATDKEMDLAAPFFRGRRSDDLELPVLTREISNYETLVQTLGAMGFTEHAAVYAIEATNARSIEAALDYLTEGEHGYEHPFIPSETVETCIICGDL
jgi:uncharacterized UBP type Zn finger protein